MKIAAYNVCMRICKAKYEDLNEVFKQKPVTDKFVFVYMEKKEIK